jgi:hypothetical protein
MAIQLLDKIMQEADALPVSEQLRLAAHLLERASEKYGTPSPRLRWQDICGLMPYPLVGEDAQAWVTRTRRESDEHRERYLRREP